MKSRLLAVPCLLAFAIAGAQAQPLPSQTIDASKMPESGPAVAGGNGATVGPNSRNQAISPMPGSRDEQVGEAPGGGRRAPITLPAPPPPVRTR